MLLATAPQKSSSNDGGGGAAQQQQQQHQQHLPTTEDSVEEQQQEQSSYSSPHLHCCHQHPKALIKSLVLHPSRMLSCLVTSAKALVLTVLSLLRKVLCFWRRGKARGGFSEIDRRQFGHSNQAGLASPRSVMSGDADSWDSWDDAPSEIVIGEKRPETVQDHIQAYRESLQEARRQASQSKEQEEEEDGQQQQQQDLFADLEPQVRRQKKLYVGPATTAAAAAAAGSGGRRRDSSSRLGVQSETAMDPVLAMGNELADWGQGGSGGAGGAWEEAGDDEDVAEAIRKQKRAAAARGSSSYASSFASN